MKKFLSLISFISLSAVSINAQESISDGYYRVYNGSGTYVSLINNKVESTTIDNLKNGGSGSLYALRLKPKDEVISDPGSIVYVKKNGDDGYSLQGQGMDTQKLTQGLYLQARNKIAGKSAPAGAFWLYGTYSGATRYVFDSVDKTDTDLNPEGKRTKYHCMYIIGLQSSGNYVQESKYAYWYFSPIDNTGEYLGITPEADIKVGDKYYTTMYCSFPFQVTGDMKAYYVSGLKSNYGAAKLNLIEDGIVPANKAVIIECTSTDPAVNKVKINVTPTVSYATNYFEGTFFSYVKKTQNGTSENQEDLGKNLKNAVSYNSSTMRVLGLSANGELAFVKATDSKLHKTDQGRYMRANKGYVEVANAAATIILNDTGIDTGISSIQNNVESTDIYNLKGQKVADKGTNLDELPRGLYIINGKKVIKD